MDPWETSVEKRLDSLDRRLTSVLEDTGQIKTDTAVLRAEMGHLPNKGYINKALLGFLVVFAALMAFGDHIRNLVN